MDADARDVLRRSAQHNPIGKIVAKYASRIDVILATPPAFYPAGTSRAT
ncbi:MAG: hypothetical protein ACJ8R9_14005 [Steroidobacteraceae bacterium]